MLKNTLLAFVILLVSYMLFWPIPIDPVAWDAPVHEGYQGTFEQNTALSDIERLDIDGTTGPEALALGPDGLIYSSSHEGWIIRFNPATEHTERWINTEGRPLGLTFDAAGHLLVADAYRGLLSIASNGELRVLTDSVDGQPIPYADDVDVAPDGKIYFSDASVKFGAEAFGGTYEASLLDIMEHGGHGRLLVYDPATDTTSVILDGLNFANGVAVSPDGQFVLVAETGHYRIMKLWLEGPRRGESEILIENLPGFPDNIEHGLDGRYWVGLVSPRNPVVDGLSGRPFLRKMAQRLPEAFRPQAEFYSHVFAMNEHGEALVSLQDPAGDFHTNTGAIEHDGWLYISSLQETHLGRLRWQAP